MSFTNAPTSRWLARLRPTMALSATGAKLIIAALTLALVVAASLTVTNGYASYLLRLIALNVIVVYGANLLLGYAGQAYLAIAATFAVGAYTSALGTTQLALPFPVTWLGGAVLAGCVGLVCGLPALRLSGGYLAMVSIGFNIVIEQILVNWTSVTAGPIGVTAIPPPSIGGYVLDGRATLALALLVAALVIAVAVALRRSQWGLALVAMRDNQVAAASLGIDTVRLKAVVFVLSSFAAGLAGGLYAHTMQYISPDISTIFHSAGYVLMLVLGGLGTLCGPLVGAVILTLLPELLSGLQQYHLLVLGCVLLGAVVFMPQGLVPLVAGFARTADKSAAGVRVIHSAPPLEAMNKQMRPAPTQLVVEDLHKSFGGITALRGVSLNVASGTIHGLIGPNGSGKSTFVNVVSGLYVPNSGTIRLGDLNLSGTSLRRVAAAGIVRTFQTPQLFDSLSVLDNIRAALFPADAPGLGTALLDLPESRAATRRATDAAMGLLRLLGLEHLGDVPASELSQGDQRRLEIGRALAARPSVLFLDEPAAGLSANESEQLCNLMEQLRDLGLALVLIEHHMDIIMRVCQRITVLDQGLVIAEGKPDEIRSNERVLSAYLGTRRQPTALVDAPRQ